MSDAAVTGAGVDSFSRRVSWTILGLVALLYVGTCFTPVIFDDNEGLYAGAVREMHARGDWLTPWSNGFPRVQKPPLVYWTMLVSTSVLGENEFALRLPNALATIGWIVATYLIARRVGDERFGIASALVLASMMGVWVFNHLVQPEPFMACFISLSLWCLVEARFDSDPPGRWYLFFWMFLALGAMSKGLHGALWPMGAGGLTALFFPATRVWLRPILTWRGLLFFAVIFVPWYGYMTWRWPGFLSAHFINEQLGASLNRRFPADARQLPIIQFYAQHLLFWLPWMLLIPGLLQVIWGTGKNASFAFLSATQKDAIRLLAVWVGLTMVSVVFSTRQDYYSMSCWGAVAMALAVPWLVLDQRVAPRLRLYLALPCGLIGVAGLAALGLAAWIHPQLDHLGAISAAPMESRDTFLDAISGISPALWARFLFLLEIFGVAMTGAGLGAAVLAWKGRSLAALFLLAGVMAVPVGLAAAGFTLMSPYFSLAEDARVINRGLADPNSTSLVACEAPPNTASSLLYYLNARVHWVNAPFDNQYAQQKLGQGHDYYWDEIVLKRFWTSGGPVYLIVEEDRLAYWQAQLPGARVLHQSGTRVVLVNR